MFNDDHSSSLFKHFPILAIICIYCPVKEIVGYRILMDIVGYCVILYDIVGCKAKPFSIKWKYMRNDEDT